MLRRGGEGYVEKGGGYVEKGGRDVGEITFALLLRYNDAFVVKA